MNNCSHKALTRILINVYCIGFEWYCLFTGTLTIMTTKEQEDLRNHVERAVRKFLGQDDSGLVHTALNCIGKGYDRRKTESKKYIILIS